MIERIRVRRTGGIGIAVAGTVWLLVGAVMTVAIAWGCSAWEGTRSGGVLDRVYDITGRTFTAPWPKGRPQHWPDDPAPTVYEASDWWIRCRVWVSGYPAADEQAQTRPTTSRVQQWEVGLPLRAMTWDAWTREVWGGGYAESRRSIWQQGVAVGTRSNFGVALPRLPLRVDWGAFIVDASVWGGLLWVVTGGMRRWKRVWRMERGRCARCGYDRSGLAVDAVCPECGCGA